MSLKELMSRLKDIYNKKGGDTPVRIGCDTGRSNKITGVQIDDQNIIIY